MKELNLEKNVKRYIVGHRDGCFKFARNEDCTELYVLERDMFLRADYDIASYVSLMRICEPYDLKEIKQRWNTFEDSICKDPVAVIHYKHMKKSTSYKTLHYSVVEDNKYHVQSRYIKEFLNSNNEIRLYLHGKFYLFGIKDITDNKFIAFIGGVRV